MSESGHDLASEFPNLKEEIHRLKISNAHFRTLMEKYRDLNKAIRRSEQRIDLLTEDRERELRVERLHIRDALFSLLSAKKEEK